MPSILRYILVFLITAIWDLIWQQMSKGNIYVCFDKKKKLLCPSDWKWVKTGDEYFKALPASRAAVIAGISGLYAMFLIDMLTPVFGKTVLNVFISSWVVGLIMRSSPDPINTYLFSTARTHYYKPLGFVWSSYTDAQSGVIVALVYHSLVKLAE